MDKRETVDVTVLVEDGHRGNMAAVARDLKDKGFILNESLNEIGVLTGSVPVDTLEALSAVRGVSTVEENRTDYRPQ